MPSESSSLPDTDYSIVIPMYREAERIGVTLDDVLVKLARAPYSSEVVLVDDGSTDDTIEVVKPFLQSGVSGNVVSVRLVRHPENAGKGAAVRTGLAACTGRWRLIMDADNAASIDQLDRLLAKTGPGVGLVAGSRMHAGASVRARSSRRIAGALYRWTLRLMGMDLLRDTQCGFKLYRSDLAAQITRHAREDGYVFDLEHLLIARASGLGVVEVGIEWTHRDGGQVSPVRDGLIMLRRALALRRRAREIDVDVDSLPREHEERLPEIVVPASAVGASAR